MLTNTEIQTEEILTKLHCKFTELNSYIKENLKCEYILYIKYEEVLNEIKLNYDITELKDDEFMDSVLKNAVDQVMIHYYYCEITRISTIKKLILSSYNQIYSDLNCRKLLVEDTLEANNLVENVFNKLFTSGVLRDIIDTSIDSLKYTIHYIMLGYIFASDSDLGV